MILTDNGKKLYLQIKDSINILNKAELLFNESRDINLGSHINMLSRLFNKAISKYYKEIRNDFRAFKEEYGLTPTEARTEEILV